MNQFHFLKSMLPGLDVGHVLKNSYYYPLNKNIEIYGFQVLRQLSVRVIKIPANTVNSDSMFASLDIPHSVSSDVHLFVVKGGVKVETYKVTEDIVKYPKPSRYYHAFGKVNGYKYLHINDEFRVPSYQGTYHIKELLTKTLDEKLDYMFLEAGVVRSMVSVRKDEDTILLSFEHSALAKTAMLFTHNIVSKDTFDKQLINDPNKVREIMEIIEDVCARHI